MPFPGKPPGRVLASSQQVPGSTLVRAQGVESRLPGILAPATSCGVVLDPDILVEVGLGFLLAGDGDVLDELLFGFRAGDAERRVSYASPAWKIFKDDEDAMIMDC